MANTKKRGRGRPQLYPVTAAQTRRIEKLVNAGFSTSKISATMNLHEFAVLRVRRAMA